MLSRLDVRKQLVLLVRPHQYHLGQAGGQLLVYVGKQSDGLGHSEKVVHSCHAIFMQFVDQSTRRNRINLSEQVARGT